jgi:hypothetical protein
VAAVLLDGRGAGQERDRGGIDTADIFPEVEALFQRQAREIDVKKREALIHQIQQILYDRTTHVPIYELADVRLKRP